MNKQKNKLWLAACLLVSASCGCLPNGTISLMQNCAAQQAGQGEQIADAKQEKIASTQEGRNMPIYDFKARALDGSDINFNNYKGDVLLIVNTASKCGYTPQYTGLEELNKKYAEKGLKVLGFPCNQFGQQEPGNSSEIGTFCKHNYGVDFQMFEKIDVNGNEAHPLYKYLTSNGGGSHPIKWNFTKFLVNRDGSIVKRYEPDTKPADIAADIEKQL